MDEAARKYNQGDAILNVRREWCKGCDLCIDACPEDILALDETDKIYVKDISACIFCGICAERCPDFVFSLIRSQKETPLNNIIRFYETDSG